MEPIIYVVIALVIVILLILIANVKEMCIRDSSYSVCRL